MFSPGDYLRELVSFLVMADQRLYQRSVVKVCQICEWLPIET